MQEDFKNTTIPDFFSENIRHKLENYELPVDVACWNEIEAKLNAPKKKKVVPFWWWLSGGAAVATLALLLTLYPASEPSVYRSKATPKNTQKETFITHKISKIQTNITKLTIKTQQKEQTQPKQQSTRIYTNQKQENSFIVNELAQLKADTTNSIKRENSKENTKKEIAANIQTDESTEVEDSVANATKKKYIPNSVIAKTKEEPIAKTKEKGEWLLAASVNQAETTSAGNSNNFLYAEDGGKYLTSATPNYTSIQTAKDFSKIKFYSALSVGLVVRKNLTKVYSIETGLMYSNLFSSFEESGFVSYDATLTLHYLGISLNFVAQLWKNQKWEFYVSGGTMVEKGIRSIYIQNQHIENQTITTTASTGIDGFQWSLNGAAGTTYKLHRNIGIYLEPKISYFFDNNQPVSARTEQPVVLGLTAGLRFQF